MSNLFGGSLSIKDGFSTTFGKFTRSLKTTNDSFKQVTRTVNNFEKTSNKSMASVKSQVMSLAQTYKRMGMTQSEAMKKAWSEVERNSKSSSDNVAGNWLKAFKKILNGGKNTFNSIQQKVSKFSNSTLGTITKLTAGFLSLKTAMNGLHTGFDTGMEYQNLRVMLNSLYGNKKLAEQKFTMGSNYAQKTMFSENDVIKALSTMKGVGISDDEKTLSMMGDLGSFVSARTNGAMGINEAVEAYADMVQNGEWERMQTILNIKRTNLEAYGKENGFKAFTNKQGQIIDRETLEKVFKSYVDTKGITGLTEVMGKTATGQLQQTVGNLQKSLADLVGISNTGEVRDGSMFQKFIQSLQKLNNKITSFSNSGQFDKIAEKLSEIGRAIYTAFNYIIEHPELITSLIKFNVAMWGLGKIGSIANSINSISGAFKFLLPILSPLAPYILAVMGTFMIAKSIFAEDGILNRGLSFFLGKIPLVGTFLQEGFDNWTRLVREFFTDIADWIKEKLGFGSKDKSTDSLADNEYNRKWYPEKFGGTVKYYTVSDMEKSGSINKTNNSNVVNNNANINFNVDTVKETADIDELMDTAMKRIQKYQNTRNTLE